jgi:tripartite-type tricarboxylate transporter receptor subunit TctC
MTALAAGEADAHITDPGSSRAMWAAGRVRPVAVTGAKRSPTMSQLPTLREEGLADYDFSAWFAAYMPTRTPPDVAAAMREILKKTLRTHDVTEFLAGSAIEPFDLAGDELTTLNRNEIEMWSRLVRTANIKLN